MYDTTTSTYSGKSETPLLICHHSRESGFRQFAVSMNGKVIIRDNYEDLDRLPEN